VRVEPGKEQNEENGLPGPPKKPGEIMISSLQTCHPILYGAETKMHRSHEPMRERQFKMQLIRANRWTTFDACISRDGRHFSVEMFRPS
jgi:hypothetical protein